MEMRGRNGRAHVFVCKESCYLYLSYHTRILYTEQKKFSTIARVTHARGTVLSLYFVPDDV